MRRVKPSPVCVAPHSSSELDPSAVGSKVSRSSTVSSPASGPLTAQRTPSKGARDAVTSAAVDPARTMAVCATARVKG